MKQIVLIISVVICLTVNLQSQTKSKIPAGWQQITACGVSFALLPDMKKDLVGGVDSCVVQYSSDSIIVLLESDGYIPSPENKNLWFYGIPKYKLEKIKIAGKKGLISTYYGKIDTEFVRDTRFTSYLVIPKFGKKDEKRFLKMFVHYKNAFERTTTQQIFNSIKLKVKE